MVGYRISPVIVLLLWHVTNQTCELESIKDKSSFWI